ncbi:protein of unknown function [Chryseobacterium taeanense]|uniref:DUF4349 domain-containing protein n=1 Tax=Chryseobacterium taeanense TaxID=311334 RepID=A0A1G8IYW9_9FLAO|nr:DUF4349 domain-containing protein [Chryseobacterium taeanense]SDI24002.1 protein of unknown function [Chryseobacterium taeanense]
MKKVILLVAVSGTFIMCKKGETVSSQLDNSVNSADSTITQASEKISEINNQVNATIDSANVKIKNFQSTGSEMKENIESTSKIIDSLSEKISSVKLESKTEKKDSAKKERNIIVHVPAPKVIRETKIVYKNQPKKENTELNIQRNKLIKKGIIDITVNDAETAKEIVKEEVAKYDGFIRSENISTQNDDKKTAYLKVKIPIQKFDYLMSDLSYNIGKIENKSIEVSGINAVENSLCEIDITLYGQESETLVDKKNENFGEKSFAAISSGWNVITSIFLFILPLWPLFVIAGIGYYFFKKRKKNG